MSRYTARGNTASRTIETAQSGNRTILGATVIVAVGLDELDVAALAGAGDFDEHATTLLQAYGYVKRGRNRYFVPLQAFADCGLKSLIPLRQRASWLLQLSNSGEPAWAICWSEVGARQAGIVQSLITTCSLHRVDPPIYFVDVLQLLEARVRELTPRLWKQHFAHQRLTPDLDGLK